MGTTETETLPSVAELCSDLVNEHFAAHPFEGFGLEAFAAPKGSVLADLRNSNKSIPKNPSSPKYPSLLLYDLQNETHKSTDVYRFIDNTKDICRGLYGTSGAGKTRSVYEYLSHNYGFYFVASTEYDPGSKDLSNMINLFRTAYARGSLFAFDGADSPSQEEQRRQRRRMKSEQNHGAMENDVRVMIYVRTVVFNAINEQLRQQEKPKLTPHDWLLIQLFPKLAMKIDLFSTVCVECFQKQHLEKVTPDADYALNQENKEWPWSVMVVDEAQVLLKKLEDFFLSPDGQKHRSAFSAVLKAMSGMLAVLNSDTGFPLVAGTGMSIDEIVEASNSIMAKNPNVDLGERTTIFKSFQPLDAKAVRDYLLTFLDLDLGKLVREGIVSNECVIGHVSRWLRGRPRWTASFLELYLVREHDEKYTGTRGSFSEMGGLLIQALDRFLENYTRDKTADIPTADRRKSFDPPKGTAFSGIKRVATKEGDYYRLIKRLESAIFNFAVGGNPVYIDEDFAELIEVGVAALSIDKDHRAVIDEPIIVQAGINYFSVKATVMDNLLGQEKGGRGDAFEKVMLPAIQRKFPQILENQLGDDGDVLKGYIVPQRSAYGVLALQCDSPSKTIEWIEAATSSTFEGQVAPFCYPDTNIGPDLIFLLRNETCTEHVTVISQAKYRKNLNQMEALRTITPKLLYYENRHREDAELSTVISNDKRLKRRWDDVRPKLVGKEHGCVRFMVQYPREHTRSANPGVLEDDEVKAATNKSDGNLNKKQKTGWLATISQSTALKLFDRNALDVLRALKADDN